MLNGTHWVGGGIIKPWFTPWPRKNASWFWWLLKNGLACAGQAKQEYIHNTGKNNTICFMICIFVWWSMADNVLNKVEFLNKNEFIVFLLLAF